MSLRSAAVGGALRAGFNALAAVARLHPLADPARHGLRQTRDLAYAEPGDPAHRLDVVAPVDGGHGRPSVLYLHGGSFRILSKDTHFAAGLLFGRRGAVVFNANYRLAPRHPFPAAFDDAAAALLWVHRHAREHGADPTRLVLAGESAGANLALALTVACCFDVDHPSARALREAGVRPLVALPAMGLLQVSDPGRFSRGAPLPWVLADRIADATGGYKPDGASHPLADPLLVWESDDAPVAPLPPVFVAAARRDPIRDDSRRLHAAAMRRGVEAEIAWGDGPHAFHFFLWRQDAREMWAKMLAFAAARW
jgi:acetyl esterase